MRNTYTESVSRGLGRVQVAMLIMLRDQPDGLIMYDLAGPDYSRASSARRALGALRAAGLVTGDRWYPHMQGRPVIWRLTDEGRAWLAAHPDVT